MITLPRKLPCPCDQKGTVHLGITSPTGYYVYRCDGCEKRFTTTDSDTLSMEVHKNKNKG